MTMAGARTSVVRVSLHSRGSARCRVVGAVVQTIGRHEDVREEGKDGYVDLSKGGEKSWARPPSRRSIRQRTHRYALLSAHTHALTNPRRIGVVSAVQRSSSWIRTIWSAKRSSR